MLVYTAQKPFHPERLHRLLSEHFSLIKEDELSSDEGSQCSVDDPIDRRQPKPPPGAPPPMFCSLGGSCEDDACGDCPPSCVRVRSAAPRPSAAATTTGSQVGHPGSVYC